MKKTIFYIVLICFLFSERNCLQSFIVKPGNYSNQNIVKISFDMNLYIESHNIFNEYTNNSLFLNFKDKRIRIDYNNQSIILDEFESINIFNNSNQLFIENADTLLLNTIFYFIDNIENEKFYTINSSNIYSINEKYGYENIEFYFNDSCILDYLKLENEYSKINISNVKIETPYNEKIFKINKEDYFNFDLRNDKK